MENRQNYIQSEDEERAPSPLPNSQESDNSIVEVNDLEQTDDHTSNVDIMANTQVVLDLPVITKRAPAKQKNKGIGKSSIGKQRKLVQSKNFFIWLKNYWDTDSTIQIMGKFVTEIKKFAMTNQKASLGRLVHPLNQIMKAFILDMDKQRHNLKKISWNTFESWALNQGLPTMFSNAQVMVWEDDFDDVLFKIYGQTYLKWQEQLQNQSSDEDEECSLLPNIMTTSTSSTTVRTVEEAVDVDSCATSKNIPQKKKIVTFNQNSRGQPSTKSSILKSKTSAKKSTSVSEKRPRKPSTTDEDSEEELILPKKKKTQEPLATTSDSEVEPSECLNDMLDAAVQAQCLLRSTGSISQTMSLKHLDNVVTLKSRGERGTKIIKLEIYPYSECLKKDKKDWWLSAEMRSLFLTYSDDSRVSKLVEKF